MTTRATHNELPSPLLDGNLFLPVPDTNFRDFLEESLKLINFCPEILLCIEADQDAHALKKKALRLADQLFFADQTAPLPGLCVEPKDALGPSGLDVGRPRLPAKCLLVFLMIRGYLGSVSDQKAYMFLRESMTVHEFLHSQGLKLPGKSTLVENLNLVSQKTQEQIHRAQMAMATDEGLDDFRDLTIDSTSVWANSAWPTDGKMIIGLLERAFRLGGDLKKFGLPGFNAGHLHRWFKEMSQIEFGICMNAGKANSKRKMKKSLSEFIEQSNKGPQSSAGRMGALWGRCASFGVCPGTAGASGTDLRTTPQGACILTGILKNQRQRSA